MSCFHKICLFIRNYFCCCCGSRINRQSSKKIKRKKRKKKNKRNIEEKNLIKERSPTLEPNEEPLNIQDYDEVSTSFTKTTPEMTKKDITTKPLSQISYKDLDLIELPKEECNDPEDYLRKHDYEILDELLGEGGFAKVYKAIKHDKNKEIVMACKVMDIRLSKRGTKKKTSLKKELYFLQKTKHDHIIKLYDYFVITSFDNQITAFIFMEFADKGTLEQELATTGPLPNRMAQRYFSQIACAVNHIHKQSIAHRDLKLANFLLITSKKKKGFKDVKISDFGLSQMAYKPSIGYTRIRQIGGTPHYKAPEIIRLQLNRKNTEFDPFKADMWALGVCLYRMLTARYPFQDSNLNQFLRNQENKCWQIPDSIQIDSDAYHLINILLEPDCMKRADKFVVISHPWLEGYTDLTVTNK